MQVMTNNKKVLFLPLLAIAILFAYSRYVQFKREPDKRAVNASRYCWNNYRNISAGLNLYAQQHPHVPLPSLSVLCSNALGVDLPHPLFVCPRGRANGKVGRFIYAGEGVDWSGGRDGGGLVFEASTISNDEPAFINLVPVLFDYPDNHPEGGYVLYNNGLTVMYQRQADWKAFLNRHLPQDYPFEGNDLHWWQWGPRQPF